MSELKWAILIIAVISIGIVGAVCWYYSATHIIEVTSIINHKYVTTDTDIVIVIPDTSVGIPLKSTNFMFLMENGDEVEVSKEEFLEYQIGDIFTYTMRVWR